MNVDGDMHARTFLRLAEQETQGPSWVKFSE